jgi:hypothetical protein
VIFILNRWTANASPFTIFVEFRQVDSLIISPVADFGECLDAHFPNIFHRVGKFITRLIESLCHNAVG